MASPHGKKPPNPKYVPKSHGKMPPAPKGYHGQNVNKGCAVTAIAMAGVLAGTLAAIGYGIVEVVS